MLNKRVAVVGLGRLGACVAAVMAEAKYEVVGVDLDEKKIDAIRKGQAPVNEPQLDEMYAEKKIYATTDVEYAVASSDMCLFAVQTPSTDEGLFTNTYLIESISAVARAVAKKGKKDYIFIINSTVNPRSCDYIFRRVISSILPNNLRWGLCYKPEFIALGSVVRDLKTPDFVLIGESDYWVGDAVVELYSKVVTYSIATPFKRMKLLEAEIAKISLNCYVTMKISFANQIGLISKDFAVDPNVILDAIGEDKRIGKRCLKPGLPFGGPCFPRDNKMFQRVTNFAPLSKATDDINYFLMACIFNDVVEAARRVKADTIGILGMAYKPGVHVTDESLGSQLEWRFKGAEFKVLTHDPYATHTSTLDEVLHCKVVVVACNHKEYSSLEVPQDVAPPVIIDPGNVVKLLFQSEKEADAVV